MKEAMPYLNIYATEEIPADMQDEVDAENAAKEEAEGAQEGEDAEGGEEEELPEGTLIDPNTGETVVMPTEEDLADEEGGEIPDSIGSPILGNEDEQNEDEAAVISGGGEEAAGE